MKPPLAPKAKIHCTATSSTGAVKVALPLVESFLFRAVLATHAGSTPKATGAGA